eukprot:6206106-Pleurochrysis_carterae.AAC.2
MGKNAWDDPHNRLSHVTDLGRDGGHQATREHSHAPDRQYSTQRHAATRKEEQLRSVSGKATKQGKQRKKRAQRFEKGQICAKAKNEEVHLLGRDVANSEASTVKRQIETTRDTHNAGDAA